MKGGGLMKESPWTGAERGALVAILEGISESGFVVFDGGGVIVASIDSRI